jgi:hypothetical protein
MRAAIYRNGGLPPILAEWVLGVAGAVLVGLGTTAIGGLVALAFFWFSPRVLGPIFVAVGLWREPPM